MVIYPGEFLDTNTMASLALMSHPLFSSWRVDIYIVFDATKYGRTRGDRWGESNQVSTYDI
jgi:hypothetical protein